jgi:hypothetical protein
MSRWRDNRRQRDRQEDQAAIVGQIIRANSFLNGQIKMAGTMARPR